MALVSRKPDIQEIFSKGLLPNKADDKIVNNVFYSINILYIQEQPFTVCKGLHCRGTDEYWNMIARFPYKTKFSTNCKRLVKLLTV